MNRFLHRSIMQNAGKIICRFESNREINMNSIAIEKFVSDLTEYHELTPKQQQNIQNLNKISKIFFTRAKIHGSHLTDNVDHALILESGHQPNFLPYSGIWKKAFLLSWFQKQLEKKGKNAIAFFGFADQNLSTAKILSKNHIPYWNKKGVEEIGFNIEDKDRFIPFCFVKKPSRERWEKEMDKIGGLYKGKKPGPDFANEKQKIDDIITIFWDSYEHSQNFAELNSTIFAKICYELLGIVNLRFYNFTDLCHEKIFIDESKEILLQQQAYNHIFNKTISDKNLDLRMTSPDRIPLWYRCDCLGKVDLSAISPGVLYGLCPLCRKEFYLDVGAAYERLDSFYQKMDFSAVSRNIVFATGMGTSLFLAGSGGSSSYGIISDEISQKMHFHLPLRLSWTSRDYYFGMFHARALQELMKTFNLAFSEISDGSFTKKIASRISEIDVTLTDAQEGCENKKTLKQLENSRNNLTNVTVSAAHLFQGIPSFLDLLSTLDGSVIGKVWEDGIRKSMVEFDGTSYKIHEDMIYQTPYFHEAGSDEIRLHYKMIESMQVN